MKWGTPYARAYCGASQGQANMQAERAPLFLLDVVAEILWSKVAQRAESQEIHVPVGSGIAGWVAQHDQLVNIPDAYQDRRFNPAIDHRTGYHTRSVLCGPVKNLQGEGHWGSAGHQQAG